MTERRNAETSGHARSGAAAVRQRDSAPRFRDRIFRAAALLAVLVFAVAAGADGQQTARARQIGKRLMCVCGCNQVLVECNHVGCRYSHDMLRELDERVAQNQSDDLTLQAFVQEYGPTVLLVPIARGFNRWVWIMPVLLPLAGLWITQRAIARWRRRAAAAPPCSAASPEMLARVERESRNPGDS
jgi:cytochrome c-type biogenesis protein CcmH